MRVAFSEIYAIRGTPEPQAHRHRTRSRRRPIMAGDEIQYVSDASGKAVAVIVPIELWREIESEKETAYLLKSEAMKRRLLEAKERQKDFSLEEARERAGL